MTETTEESWMPPKTSEQRQGFYALAAGWALVFMVTVAAYWPGLGGPFLFDDYGSIAPLGNQGGVNDWESFKLFVFGGHAGPTGRPLALLTFLLDANNWPADAWPFKRTNLLIHLVNGFLLGVLTRKILCLLDYDARQAASIALLAAACWLLHPFLVSTTLYAVQRMAQLSALFVFLGLIGYLRGRVLVDSDVRRGYLWMSLSLGVCTLLAILCKENGLLLPLLTGVVEFTVIASRRNLMPLNRYWHTTVIVLPWVVVGAYLTMRLFRSDFFEIVPPRDFSAYERLLTQPRILIDYLHHWFVPELFTAGIFQDQVEKSTGLLAPATTLLSLLVHAVLLTLAVVKRHAWPLFSLAVLFFYTGHLLESTVINLELYFEHRNYLPAAFLILPLAAWIHRSVSKSFFVVVGVAAVLLLSGFTRYTSVIWGDYATLVEAAVYKAPRSARAHGQHALNLYNTGRFEEALVFIDQAIEDLPESQVLRINRGIIRCNLGLLSTDDFDRMAVHLAGQIYDPRVLNLYETLNKTVLAGKCPEVLSEALVRLYRGMLEVPENGQPGTLRYSQVQYFVGSVELRSGDVAAAVSAFEESLKARPGAAHAMRMAAELASNEHYDEALYFSDVALQSLQAEGAASPGAGRVRFSDIEAFRETVRAESESVESGD